MEWALPILFGAWAVVATSLTIFLIWEGIYAKPKTKESIEAEAIRSHFAAEQNRDSNKIVKLHD